MSEKKTEKKAEAKTSPPPLYKHARINLEPDGVIEVRDGSFWVSVTEYCGTQYELTQILVEKAGSYYIGLFRLI